MKALSPGTEVRMKTGANGRPKHAIVVTVTDQNTITARVGRSPVVAATRGASTTTRGTIFTTP